MRILSLTTLFHIPKGVQIRPGTFSYFAWVVTGQKEIRILETSRVPILSTIYLCNHLYINDLQPLPSRFTIPKISASHVLKLDCSPPRSPRSPRFKQAQKLQLAWQYIWGVYSEVRPPDPLLVSTCENNLKGLFRDMKKIGRQSQNIEDDPMNWDFDSVNPNSRSILTGHGWLNRVISR